MGSSGSGSLGSSCKFAARSFRTGASKQCSASFRCPGWEGGRSFGRIPNRALRGHPALLCFEREKKLKATNSQSSSTVLGLRRLQGLGGLWVPKRASLFLVGCGRFGARQDELVTNIRGQQLGGQGSIFGASNMKHEIGS